MKKQRRKSLLSASRAERRLAKITSDIAGDANLISLVVHAPHEGLFPRRVASWAVHGIILSTVIAWSAAERLRATRFAAALHLRASDNDVKTGKRPKCLVKLEDQVADVFRSSEATKKTAATA